MDAESDDSNIKNQWHSNLIKHSEDVVEEEPETALFQTMKMREAVMILAWTTTCVREWKE